MFSHLKLSHSVPPAIKDRFACCRLDEYATYIFAAFALAIGEKSAFAENFNNASKAELTRVCGNPFDPASTFATGNLLTICQELQQGGQTSPSGVGTQSQPNSLLISQQQLKDLQTKKLTENRKPGSADVIGTMWGDKFSTFLTAGATTLRHQENEFEQGYNATIPSVTIGGGYAITEDLEMGLAFNYSNSSADFNSGGGFDVDSYTPLLYVNYLPFDNAFVNLALSYTRQNQSNNRLAIAGLSGIDLNPDGSRRPISRSTNGNVDANQYNLNLLSGYDFAVENVTIGPRFGVDARQWEMNGYQETSNTGLELRYNDQYQTSVQSRVGLFASSAHSFDFGVLVPQISAYWVHEFLNGARTVNAHFVQTTDFETSSGFFFQTENPARNWAVIDLGVSLVMQKGLQAFVNFSTVQGNRNFESYGGNVGMRVEW